ncbi:hypothetical protein A6V39_01640 [Candidatus Mycoplasma haematobovis]|uniref:Uncharacterized protein n=1 Tax=Candidatus Mycoplasma haematobovis TaxID=432608 RepID=A0A1A9QFJ6_9MOLU|nr:hypothetical protein [Candidatus Mycoplasma haematobovis]OAL10745.1 hypothetical protein A6V39_01640 [Candidatus Mycoplasma haematobovis]
MSGVKLNNTTNWNKKVAHFGKLRNHFNKNVPDSELRNNWYFPRWEDDAIWKKHWERGDNKKAYASPEAFRDWCYQKLEQQQQTWVDCNPSQGWCEICTRGKSWD